MIMMKKIYTMAVLLLAVSNSLMAQESETEKSVAWTVPANYYSEPLDANFETTLTYYTDGSISLSKLYGSDYTLEMKIDTESVVDGIPEISFLNYYTAAAPYYYFYAGDYTLCIYYQQGSGYSGWEGDAEEPELWFYNYLYKGDAYIKGGYDIVTWSKNNITGIASVAASADKADSRIFSLSGMSMKADGKLAPGLYIRNGKKMIIK